MIEFYLFQELV